MESPVSGREKGKHNKGIARHRTEGEAGRPERRTGAAAPDGPPSRSGGIVGEKKSLLFAKPSLDDMGPGTDMGKPAGAVSRSLFKKQTHSEAHGSDFGIPGEGEKSLFRKNSLDEMTVRRTEKPVEGTLPPRTRRGGEVRSPPQARTRGHRLV